MITYKKFDEIYNERNKLPEDGWIYIKEDDFQDLETATYFVLENEEDDPDDYVETEDDVVPKILFDIDKSITGLVEFHTFKAIYENMEKLNKEFDREEKIEALYHYVEEDTFLY
ncbi:DUF7716 domain-containing protein [uncultured Aquimarina sp.]|uniref:DUF7716 domain-containing protein n=1 Tax=uncultured Aquimarina sp. TaxID=575652 RepID=UPI00262AFAAD|nr:hypothetical protein [uncultured Aquimarina sp.]